MGAYQVWHRGDERYRLVAEVQADGLLEVVEFTQNQEYGRDPHEGQRWIDQAGVIVAIDAAPRSTTHGDIVIDPDGLEYEVTRLGQDGTERFALQLTTSIGEQAYCEWLDDMTDFYGERPDTPDELAAVLRSWREDAVLQALAEKGVDYSDAPYGEPVVNDYADTLKAAIARARHQAPPEPDAPRL